MVDVTTVTNKNEKLPAETSRFHQQQMRISCGFMIPKLITLPQITIGFMVITYVIFSVRSMGTIPTFFSDPPNNLLV